MGTNILPISELSNTNSPSGNLGEWPTTKDIATEQMSSIPNIAGIDEQDNEKSRRQEFWGVLEHASIDVSPHTNSPKVYSPANHLNPYYCNLCQTEMTGPEPYQQHLSGSSHARQFKRKNLENSLKEVDRTNREENMLQNNSVVHPVSPSPLNYHCPTCNTTMSGIEPYQQHLRGIQHLKKERKILLEKQMLSPVTPMQQESVLPRNTSPLQASVNIPVQPVVPQYYCNVCNISMSGIEPYQQHMKGGPHLKRAKNKELLEIHTLEQQKQAIASSEYYCRLCNKLMSGYEPYLSHMSGSQHAKEVNRQRLMETPIRPPQSVLQITPVTSSSMPEIPSECRQALKCDVCAKRFSGIESLQDHFRSLKHKKKVQQMQMGMSVDSNNVASDDPVNALAERVQSGLQISTRGTAVQQPMNISSDDRNVTSSDDMFKTCHPNQDVQTSFNSFV